MIRIAFVLLPIVMSLGAARAVAATVVIVRPPGASPQPSEILSRLKGELLSLGLEVAITDRPITATPGTTAPLAWLQRIARERDSNAAIDVIGDTAPLTVDILIIQPRTGLAEITRVALAPDTENAAERLAIRAIEVLRSSLTEIDLVARGQRSAPVALPAVEAVVDRGPPPPAVAPQRVDLGAGAAVLAGLDGVGPALLPTVRFGWAVNSWVVLQGSLAGLGSRPVVTSAAGSARIAQQFGLLGWCACGPTARSIHPYLGLAVGVMRTSVAGQAPSPEQAHLIQRWSFLVDASLGARLRLPGRYHLTLATHVQVTQPYIAIHVVDTQLATTGRPNLLVSLTVGAWL